MKPPDKQGLRPKGLKQDDSIMGTNNSSIVSKRSVERLYYPHEPHFFRWFVKKPQRRAPLINRGYWLRMKAVDHVVRQFLEESTTKQKLVINLGCGYDPLPWQCLLRYSENCDQVKFIDVDYKDLMVKKRDMVKATAELSNNLTNLTYSDVDDLLLRSDQYVQVGCDLRELSNLSKALSKIANLDECVILFTAEVSVTYMKLEAADALIKWAGSLPEARFCLLEQLLPEGIDYPFAKTMMAHFEKLQTPLQSIQKYPTTMHQENRFRDSGWSSASACNLWELWASPDFLSSNERMALDLIEPFDEWEEFAVFGSHYFLLVAKNSRDYKPTPLLHTIPASTEKTPIPHAITAHVSCAESVKLNGCRRFAAYLPIKGSNPRADMVGNFGGLGPVTRTNSYDVFTKDSQQYRPYYQQSPSLTPSSRMCHTITSLGDAGSLLVGGRTSPDGALADCWFYHKWTNIWERIEDLPKARYRHSAVAIGSDTVLIFGGKENSKSLLTDFLVWNRRHGWRTCEIGEVNGERASPVVFGAIACVREATHTSLHTQGILAGGILPEGIVMNEVWQWSLEFSENNVPIIAFHVVDPSLFQAHEQDLFSRFGASVIFDNDKIIVVGGIARNRIFKANEEICIIKITATPSITPVRLELSSPRPLLIGSSLYLHKDKLVVLGGGAVCFSFGTFWNKGSYTISLGHLTNHPDSNSLERVSDETWQYLETIEASSQTAKASSIVVETKRATTIIPRVRLSTSQDFSTILSSSQPVILEGLELGACTTLWTNDYLKDRIGNERKVVVHNASTTHMDFTSKNFEYITKPFGDFVDAVENGGKLYLRSLSAEKPSELPASLSRDFPELCDDFKLPSELAYVTEQAHSSPLRISGPVNMWLHYDVMSNVLCQIRGTKRLLLFPPADVVHFDFAPGASSSGVDAFTGLNSPELALTHQHEALLRPGDVLFIPMLWLHTAAPIDGVSISVNVFFRGLNTGYAAGKDVYGNRDLQAYEKGRQDIAKLAKAFESLPLDVRGFYLGRLAAELDLKARE